MIDEDGEPLGEVDFNQRPITPEVRLWQAKVVQHVQDTRNLGKAGQFDRDAAFRWLRPDNPDFRITCELAGWVPEDVYRKFVALPAGQAKRKRKKVKL